MHLQQRTVVNILRQRDHRHSCLHHVAELLMKLPPNNRVRLHLSQLLVLFRIIYFPTIWYEFMIKHLELIHQLRSLDQLFSEYGIVQV